MNYPNKDKPDEIRVWAEDDVIDSNLRRREDEQLARRPIEQQTFISKEDFVRVLTKFKTVLETNAGSGEKVLQLYLDVGKIEDQITKKPKEGEW